jgi:two-component system sensor histidine kinase UhpB
VAGWTRALQTGERYESEFRLRRHDGEYRWHHTSGAPLLDARGRPARWFGTCTDIEAEVRSAQILESMVEERTRELRDSEQRFQDFMQHAPALTWIKDSKLRYVFVNRPWEETQGRRMADVVGRDDFELFPEALARRRRAEDEEVLGRRATFRNVRPIQSADGVERHWFVVKFPLADPTGGLGVAGVGIDITSRVKAEEQARGYSADVRRLLDRLIFTQESERRRLADELHDLIGQNLTALGIDLTTLREKLHALGNPVQGARIDAMRVLVEQTIDAIRGVMTDLRPPELEEFGLVPALRGYAAEFTRRTGMKATVSVSGRERRFARECEFALFRIAQEALTNAAKHSGGTTVTVKVAEAPGRISVGVEDDGRGFDNPSGARSAQRGGWGLPTMRERAEAHGGQLRVEFPGRGTRLVVEIPVDAD